jgi:hypothetical protein
VAPRNVRNRARSSKKLVKRRKVGRMSGNGERDGPREAVVVLTETVMGIAEAPSVADGGETVQVDSAGAPIQLKETVPPLPTRLTVYVADCPGETVAVVEEPEPDAKAKSTPEPFRLTV